MIFLQCSLSSKVKHPRSRYIDALHKKKKGEERARYRARGLFIHAESFQRSSPLWESKCKASFKWKRTCREGASVRLRGQILLLRMP